MPDIASMHRLLDADVVVCINAAPYQYNKNLFTTVATLSNISHQAIAYINTGDTESTSDKFYLYIDFFLLLG